MKIGIVNDVPMIVEVLRRVLAEHSDHQLIWVAQNGEQAAEMCAWQLPDIVLMDLIMPKVDGVEATRRIMQATPCPILIVTSDIGANIGKVYEALGHGALDVVATPTLSSDDAQSGAATILMAKIEQLSRMEQAPSVLLKAATPVRAEKADASTKLVAIGASAGGPAALAELLKQLPQDFPAAIVIVQHIDAAFSPGMADWLQQQTSLEVRLAKEGDQAQKGLVLMAGTSHHLLMKTGETLGYAEESPMDVYHPSIDVFFNSVVEKWRGKVIGVLLTGMGRDGALGLKAMHTSKHHTIVQDQKSCSVYGMPKAAVALNAATEVLALTAIAPRLIELLDPRE
ncbi:chemotaxis response regulator protein-glutamate methylesterase [Herminiimonas sp. NPDC097707]|uniref:chemotaxis response regulator protein-glutamate methylesterase n=1 Tax=Herminiimonas sp. NPDC097707 TaxID=3364007 RepID=UPI00383A4683